MSKQATNRWQLPSLASYQGQYLYMALALTAALLLIAWAGHRYVENTTAAHIGRISGRAATQEQVVKLQQLLQNIEQSLALQIIEPGSTTKAELTRMLDELGSHFRTLAREISSSGGKAVSIDSPFPPVNLPAFQADVMGFLHISRNNMLRFPSISIMHSHMQPRSQTVMDILDNLIYEASENSSDNAYTRLAYQARLTWQLLLSEFRLLVANRFSVFSDTPLDGMASRTYNVELYLEQMHALVEKLKTRLPQEMMLPLSEEIWRQLETDIAQWQKHYRGVVSSLNSRKWRHDLYLFKTSILPQIAGMKARLNQLQQAIDRQASKDITELANSASRLSQTILLIAVIGMLLILGAYYYLKSRVIKPMSDTADALRQEAGGDSRVVIPTPKLKETRDLVEAFGEMRRQVIKREHRLNHLAHHDPLTQLPNRLLFKDRLEHALEIAARHNQVISCLFLDLDNFKQINDTLGHFAGDELLVTVARRLKKVVRRSDTIARLGGDEFAILLEDIKNKDFVCNIARKILHALEQPFLVNGREFHITTSIGITIGPDDDNQPDDLLRDADAAMYEAKRQGKNNYQFFTRELLHRANRQLDLEQRLHKAIRHNELLFHYQPIMDANTGQLAAVEALMRWQPKDGSPMIYPSDFVELLKNLSLEQGKKLNEQLSVLLNRVQGAALREHGISLRVALNMSPVILRDHGRQADMIACITGLDFPSLITIEITEDTLMEDLSNARDLLGKLRQMGASLALDDFGTGQSSLNHLRSFPFDSIKIDREFVRHLTSDPEDALLVQAIVQLAHSFNMKVVAEGVETEEQKRHLVGIGCDYLQGYLISKPLPEEQLLAFLEKHGSKSV